MDSPIPTSPGLDLIIGPMYSSKTTELLRRLFVCSAVGFKVLYVNHSSDNRNSQDVYSTHNPLYRNKIEQNDGVTMISVECLSELFNDPNNAIEDYLVIGIDEGQFFTDLKDSVLELVEKYNRYVIVSGLNGDSDRNSFGQICELIPYCDHIHKLYSYCQCCAQNNKVVKALFTKRISNESTQIVIGAKETYVPVCRECYLDDK
jgi:thymidine kinase